MNYTKNEHNHYVWPTLYKTASKGKEQQWDICVVPLHGERGDIVVEHGQVGGKIQVAIVTVEKGKNLGKKNATTGKEQAVLEAQAKWLKQQDKGYSVERGGGSMELKPMLAHKYEDVKDIVFPAHIQPKLDGCRCLAYRESEDVVRLISRQGKDFGKWLGHIREALKHMMKVGDVFDGELYVHGTSRRSCPGSKRISQTLPSWSTTSTTAFRLTASSTVCSRPSRESREVAWLRRLLAFARLTPTASIAARRFKRNTKSTSRLATRVPFFVLATASTHRATGRGSF
jgi:hypothetical protein